MVRSDKVRVALMWCQEMPDACSRPPGVSVMKNMRRTDERQRYRRLPCPTLSHPRLLDLRCRLSSVVCGPVICQRLFCILLTFPFSSKVTSSRSVTHRMTN